MNKRPTNRETRQNHALEFHVSRGIGVELAKEACGRVFAPDAVNNIVSKYKQYADCYGCYIYSVKAGKGFTPIYVGSATRQTLGKEAFDSDKALKCLQHMATYKKGSLQITFIVPKDKVDSSTKTRRGRCPQKAIKKLEKVLTAMAFRKNHHLINAQNLCLADFYINGVLNSDVGRPPEEVSAFKSMMGLQGEQVFVVG